MSQHHQPHHDAGSPAAHDDSEIDLQTMPRLANEANMLSWMRNAIILLTLGIGAGRLIEGTIRFHFPLVFGLSLLFALSGIASAAVGWHRYRQVQIELERGFIRPERHLITAFTTMIVAVGVVVVIIIILVELEAS